MIYGFVGNFFIFFLIYHFWGLHITLTKFKKVMVYYSKFLILIFFVFFFFFSIFAEYSENSYIPNIVATTVSLIFMISFGFLPESPRFLCFKRETNLAREIVAKFKSIDADIEENLRIWSQRDQIVEKDPVKILFDGTLTPKQLVTLIGLVIFEQLIGAISALFYMHKILNLTRTNNEKSSKFSLQFGNSQLVSFFFEISQMANLHQKWPQFYVVQFSLPA